MTTDCRTQLASLALGELEKGDFLMATKILTTGIRLEPNNHELYFDRSICYHKLGDYRASLDDANTAIRLNSSDFSIHYQKGLALIGLSMLPEAIISFKKAIELRAKQEDTRLSDIFKLLRDAMNELTTARGRLGLINTQSLGETTPNSTIPNTTNQTRTIHSIAGPSSIKRSHPDNNNDDDADRVKSINHHNLHNKIINNSAHNQQQQQNNIISKNDSESHNESNIDVDDSITNSSIVTQNTISEPPISSSSIPVVAISASSSSSSSSNAIMKPEPSTSNSTVVMTATATTTATKDDSYSSKYKRLRRDRERARRGTSKLCTIKPSDLEELNKSTGPDVNNKRFMRVIAPIDGWLYSGQLSLNNDNQTASVSNNNNNNLSKSPQYVIKLDGDPTGSSYLFNQESVLNDVIKEVSVKSVSELRKGARICCYWSRQYKCLSTGVVTSRTFEATKSLVSVKYDNGDLSALPLEDLRLLPPDYPKYMSNCDPLLLARNNGNRTPIVATTTTTTTNSNNMGHNRTIIENQHLPIIDKSEQITNSNGIINDTSISSNQSSTILRKDGIDNHQLENQGQVDDNEDEMKQTEPDGNDIEVDEENVIENDDDDDDDDATIPPTNETIQFITSDTPLDNDESVLTIADDNIIPQTTLDDETSEELNEDNNTSRASSEENKYTGLEYRPWMFEGIPKRVKRHGRNYRDNYLSIRRGNEIIRVGDSAELMPRDESILPFIAKIDGFWSTPKGEMRVRVRWYYRLIETEGENYDLHDGENALFETDHFDENDVQSIYRATKILSWTDYEKNHLGHINQDGEKIFYLAGYYDPVRRVKVLRTDVKEAQ